MCSNRAAYPGLDDAAAVVSLCQHLRHPVAGLRIVSVNDADYLLIKFNSPLAYQIDAAFQGFVTAANLLCSHQRAFLVDPVFRRSTRKFPSFLFFAFSFLLSTP